MLIMCADTLSALYELITFVPDSSVEVDGNGRVLDPHDQTTDETNGMCAVRESGSELFGFIGLRIIHPAGSFRASFPKASHEPCYSYLV